MNMIKTAAIAALAILTVGCTTIQVGTEETRNVQRGAPGEGVGVAPAADSRALDAQAPVLLNVRSNTTITLFGSSDIDEVAPR